MTSYTLTIVSGPQPNANGEELGLGDLSTPEVLAQLQAAGYDPDDTDMWVLVTPADEHPGELYNVVGQITEPPPALVFEMLAKNAYVGFPSRESLAEYLDETFDAHDGRQVLEWADGAEPQLEMQDRLILWRRLGSPA